ncbi:MAG: mandelate racemase/muconate lactonizing enzyme family protein, partial [Deltaproteobacteria bacterium]
MKITEIKTFLLRPAPKKSRWNVAKHLLLVKVETDEAIVGWGEAFTLRDREGSLVQNVASLTRYMIGRDPFNIKAFTQWASNRFSEGRGSVELFSAVSGIEQALWDIVGKRLKTPVYNLLGGPCRDRIKVYANGWTSGAKTAGEMADRAVEVVRMGFNAIKFYPFQNDEPEKTIVGNVRAVREAVGPEIDILIDVWRRPEPSLSIRVARRMEEFNVFWYEEPVPSENLDLLAEVRRSINLPVVTGECLYTKHDFREALERRAADILNPDVASCGGILELKEIAAMAEPYYVQISPHNYNSTAVGLAATLQVSAVIPNFVMTEYFINFQELGDAISVNPFRIEKGSIRLPSSPGLGIEINEA